MQRVLLLAAAIALFALPFAMTMPASAAKEGELCDGFAQVACDKGLFCEHDPGCTSSAGVCEKQPESCADTRAIMEVCGCDQKTYNNDCERKMAGVQKKKDGRCTNKKME